MEVLAVCSYKGSMACGGRLEESFDRPLDSTIIAYDPHRKIRVVNCMYALVPYGSLLRDHDVRGGTVYTCLYECLSFGRVDHCMGLNGEGREHS